MPQRVLMSGLVCAVVANSVVLLIQVEAHILLTAEQEEELGSPTCGVFYDKWEVKGFPAAMLAMAGIGRELMAAQDCIEKENESMACQHWSKVLEVTDKLGPPFDQDRVGIEQMMREHHCDADAEQSDSEDARESAE